ncbi:MAG TPA: VOC family protein [Rhabdochlamydiaceae bacterium]|jgi:predicted enzyme related to lactoylglutathione lyase|nr:VOC family protein [Rhabdochlamydiaceae bacterium]
MITTIKHAVIPYADQERALKFYTEKLGFTVAVDVTFGDQRWIELKLPESQTCVVLHTTNDQKEMLGKFSNVIFSCADVKETTEQLKAKGVEIVEGPVDQEWGTYSIFKDSEGNMFCLSNT